MVSKVHNDLLEKAYRSWKGIGTKPDLNEAIALMEELFSIGGAEVSTVIKQYYVEMLYERRNNRDLETMKGILDNVSEKNIFIDRIRLQLMYNECPDTVSIEKMIATLEEYEQYDESLLLWHYDVLQEHNHDSAEAEELLKRISSKYSRQVEFRKKRRLIESNGIMKSNKKTDVNFMLVSSNEYAKYANVLISSIVSNHHAHNINIFVMTTGMSSNNRKMLEDNNAHDVAITIIDIDVCAFERVNYPEGAGLWTRACLVRLVPHLYLPKHISRVISIGVDLVVDGDISELFEFDFGNHAIAGTLAGSEYSNIYELKTKNNVSKINGDFLVFNLDKMRKDDVSVESYIKHIQPGCYSEEQLLPALYPDGILLLDTYVYNYRLDPTHRAISRERLLVRHPKVIQYIYYQKPWSFYLFDDEMSDERASKLYSNWERNALYKKWWKYALNASNYGELVGDLKIQRATLAAHASKMIEKHTGNKTNTGASELTIGRMYRDGIGFCQDYIKSAEWMFKALEYNNQIGNELFDVLWNINLPDYTSKLYQVVQPLAEQGDHNASARLGRIYYEGRGMKKDLKMALHWFKDAYQDGEGVNWAVNGIMDALWEIGTYDSHKEMYTISYLEAEKGNKHAMGRLGMIYKEGKYVEHDFVVAAYWFRKACNLGENWTKHKLMEVLWDIGTPDALLEFKPLAEELASKGSYDAGLLLEMVK